MNKKERLSKSKKIIKAFREDRKKTSSSRKRTIIPGPWTGLDTKLELKPTLREHHSICAFLGSYYGTYRYVYDWKEKGWYPLAINIVVDDLRELVKKHGTDQVMAACEKALNNCLDENNKKKYGDLILTVLVSDNSQLEDQTRRFLSCRAKTNKKRINGFLATRQGKLLVIGPMNEEQENNQQNQDISEPEDDFD